ncbi:hypothetical protein WKW77_25930 [Variovorax ureilyticus]|uniref:Uncharacterized protein n=1 Tax=Variovorax ureilyticus TaxID=1836198 RepID=A0ABU8VLT2_9BURK
MKVASFNVNGIKGRMPRLLEVNDLAFRRNAGFRMDFILLNPGLVNRVQATGVDVQHRGSQKPSAHAPVGAQHSTGS